MKNSAEEYTDRNNMSMLWHYEIFLKGMHNDLGISYYAIFGSPSPHPPPSSKNDKTQND